MLRIIRKKCSAQLRGEASVGATRAAEIFATPSRILRPSFISVFLRGLAVGGGGSLMLQFANINA